MINNDCGNNNNDLLDMFNSIKEEILVYLYSNAFVVKKDLGVSHCGISLVPSPVNLLLDKNRSNGLFLRSLSNTILYSTEFIARLQEIQHLYKIPWKSILFFI